MKLVEVIQRFTNELYLEGYDPPVDIHFDTPTFDRFLGEYLSQIGSYRFDLRLYSGEKLKDLDKINLNVHAGLVRIHRGRGGRR